MSVPTLCMIFEHITATNAIGKVAIAGIKVALEAGWSVTAVANTLDETLQSQVEWLPLTVPKRLYLVKWLTARHYMKQALGSRTFDVVHAHQPQAASLADVYQCHFITRAAMKRHSLKDGDGVRATLNAIQIRAAVYAEDYYYRHWNPNTRMLYDSELTRRDFHDTYGPLPVESVQVYACPDLDFPSDEEKREARCRLVGTDYKGPILGYLGGLNERKGYRKLLAAMERDKGLFLLMGGMYTENFAAPALAGRFRAVGPVRDVASFYAACDVFIVPSDYEPLGLVAFEAAARGVPVIATEQVGALKHLREYGVGEVWRPTESLEPLVERLIAQRKRVRDGACRMAADMGQKRYGEQLLSVYGEVMNSRGISQ